MKTIIPTAAQADLIRRTLSLGPEDSIPVLTPMEGGLTNHSFLFENANERYILREPGKESFSYIDRYAEAEAYAAVRGLIPTDEVLALEPETGRKITRFWPNARICDPHNEQDVSACMKMLRRLHQRALTVPHRYDIFSFNQVHINWLPDTSVYPDHDLVQRRCMDMEPVLRRFEKYAVLSHCDTVASNFLFLERPEQAPELRVIDWEYAGMFDPCADIGMFADDGGYSPRETDRLMRIYLEEEPTLEFTLRVYAYLALIGLCYSNWEEHVRVDFGMNLGDYGMKQFNSARVYSKLFWDLLPQVEAEERYGAR